VFEPPVRGSCPCACGCSGVGSWLRRLRAQGAGTVAVAGEAGGFAVALEEGAVGHDEVDLDSGDAAGGSGGAFDQGVGLDLSQGAGVPGGVEGVGVPCQCRVHGDSLVDGQQRRQVRHAARGRAQAHPPLRGGVAGALGNGTGIPPGRGGADRGDDGPGSGAGEGSGVGGEFLVHGGPVRATVRQAVSLTTYMARSSLSCPVSSAARVWGISAPGL
jgi:hypothetical protein